MLRNTFVSVNVLIWPNLANLATLWLRHFLTARWFPVLMISLKSFPLTAHRTNFCSFEDVFYIFGWVFSLFSSLNCLISNIQTWGIQYGVASFKTRFDAFALFCACVPMLSFDSSYFIRIGIFLWENFWSFSYGFILAFYFSTVRDNSDVMIYILYFIFIRILLTFFQYFFMQWIVMLDIMWWFLFLENFPLSRLNPDFSKFSDFSTMLAISLQWLKICISTMILFLGDLYDKRIVLNFSRFFSDSQISRHFDHISSKHLNEIS